jgi:phage-related protein
MPKTEVIFYKDDDGKCLLLECLDRWKAKVQDKFVVRIERLQDVGHELRRPEAAILRDGIHELRVRDGSINYRVLYFFIDKSPGEKLAVLFDGLTKEAEVPPKDIDRAIKARKKFAANPKKYTYERKENDD